MKWLLTTVLMTGSNKSIKLNYTSKKRNLSKLNCIFHFIWKKNLKLVMFK